jgi:hypothetical protein
MFTPEMKRAAAALARDKDSKTSHRIMSYMYYLVIRACEIIDWWFPTEYERLQRKRVNVYMNDPPNIPLGATVEIDPATGVVKTD